jgi:hypothetical protein
VFNRFQHHLFVTTLRRHGNCSRLARNESPVRRCVLSGWLFLKKIRRGGMAGRTWELARHDDRRAKFEISVATALPILAENAG